MQSQASGEPSEPAASILAQVRCGATVQHSSAVHGFVAHETRSAGDASPRFPAGQEKSSGVPSAFVSPQVRGTVGAQSPSPW